MLARDSLFHNETGSNRLLKGDMNDTTKHTPGPWFITALDYLETGGGATGRRLAIVGGGDQKGAQYVIGSQCAHVCTVDRSGPSAQMDAALIASAPDLAHEVETLRRCLGDLSPVELEGMAAQGGLKTVLNRLAQEKEDMRRDNERLRDHLEIALNLLDSHGCPERDYSDTDLSLLASCRSALAASEKGEK